MPTSHEVAYRLYGAWRLLWLDRGGLAFFDGRARSFLNSFFAAVLVAPAYIIIVLLSLSERQPVAGTLDIILVEAIAYVISWTAFPVAFHALADLFDRQDRYFSFIVTFNWAQVIKMALYLPAILLGALAVLPTALTSLLSLLATLAVLAYGWFVTRVALDLSGMAAAGLVAIDLVLGLFITGYANAIIF